MNSRRFTIFVAVTLVAFCSAAMDPVRRDGMLRVVGEVHSNRYVVVNSWEKRAKKHPHCVDTGAVDKNPVCASTGVLYMNKDVFEFHKCLIEAQYGDVITVAEIDLCKKAKREDDEHTNVYYDVS
ncbi:hypothetical protein CCR75_003290 [Bremia lactucae]|uniref:Kazal-like domain-containing protein n=1 Tax=Bremia lactucae TaxID=4779 RepID=A0A976NXZ5_BRELC|nr:hypothetical protein CCR75_003290 [Bremia lactucae]